MSFIYIIARRDIWYSTRIRRDLSNGTIRIKIHEIHGALEHLQLDRFCREGKHRFNSEHSTAKPLARRCLRFHKLLEHVRAQLCLKKNRILSDTWPSVTSTSFAPCAASISSPRLDRATIFLPFSSHESPLHFLFLQKSNRPIIQSSGDRSLETCRLPQIGRNTPSHFQIL